MTGAATRALVRFEKQKKIIQYSISRESRYYVILYSLNACPVKGIRHASMCVRARAKELVDSRSNSVKKKNPVKYRF